MDNELWTMNYFLYLCTRNSKDLPLPSLKGGRKDSKL